jgi:hypothetical protein
LAFMALFLSSIIFFLKKGRKINAWKHLYTFGHMSFHRLFQENIFLKIRHQFFHNATTIMHILEKFLPKKTQKNRQSKTINPAFKYLFAESLQYRYF